MTQQQNSNHPLLRTLAWIVMLVGMVGSLYFMYEAGHNQKSFLLLGLFTGWVLSPFVLLYFSTRITNHWLAIKSETLLYLLMIMMSIFSLVAYSGVLIPVGTKPAFIFLVFPTASWVLIITVLLIERNFSQKN